jgi:diguanylate cyclase (GGDEF)-like protein
VFKLRRYFSITSLIGVLVVIICLLLFYRHFALRALIDNETRSNVAITHVLANALWSKHAAFVATARHQARERLATRPEIARIHADVARQMRGLNVVKIKIYDVSGLTVFSTDPRQIGEDKRDNPGFRNARHGAVISSITYRDHIDSFEGTLVDRNLIYSYIPIRQNRTGPIEGVFEVYTDVSVPMENLERAQWQITALLFGTLALLYCFLHLLVHRADKIIQAQSEEERLANAEKLRYRAFHDSLTGLPNRAKFAERLEETILQAKRSNRIFAVLFIDLDNFKTVNDSLGHYVGDMILKTVGQRLRATLRDMDIVARVGGDEFIILLTEISRIEHAALVAEKILELVSHTPYRVDERELSLTVSVGLSVYPDDGEDALVLIKNADAAMYHSKEMGRNNYQFFKQDMNARAFALLSMEHGLRHALEREELVLHFQPSVGIAEARVLRAEALIRWRHPEMGLVSPDRFIPIAEERGLIESIGKWVLLTACTQARAWHKSGLATIPVSVNVSAVQFRQPDFIDTVAEALERSELSSEFLELEITESTIMRGNGTLETVRQLKAMGVSLAIDDFGTGYSSLGYLKQFPIDRLKLNESFVHGLPMNTDDLAIASTVLALAKTLKLPVIAEGVETRAQLDYLTSQRCDEAQGFYFSRALPPQEFESFIRQPERVRAKMVG